MGANEAASFLKKYDNFVITAHTNLEGDALGSELAMLALARRLGKKAVVINEDECPQTYRFLPYSSSILKFKKSMRQPPFEALVVLDCSDPGRTGEVYSLNAPPRPVLNIDHHISNSAFGDVNWVDAKASSCSELIYRLYKQMKVPFTRESALCLYTGLVTDTGSFRYPNTSRETHLAAAELLTAGIDASRVYRTVYETVPFGDLKFLASLLPGMRREAGGRIVWFEISRDALEGKKLTLDLSEHILTFARTVKGVEVAALFKENLGGKREIRVNLRSQGRVDVNRIAKSVGGGGHKTASGATVKGSLAGVRRQVLRRIKAAL